MLNRQAILGNDTNASEVANTTADAVNAAQWLQMLPKGIIKGAWGSGLWPANERLEKSETGVFG